jgi:tRNA 2-selenouridine synthase
LEQLKLQGEQVIDLEALACHKGSAFGRIPWLLDTPSQEQFENNLAWHLAQLQPGQTTWVENESQRIGNVLIPQGLWELWKQSPLLFLQLDLLKRRDFLLQDYGYYSAGSKEEANKFQLERTFVPTVTALRKKLGNETLTLLLTLAEAGDWPQGTSNSHGKKEY